MSSPLPQSVMDLIENKPVEDVLLKILRVGLPDVPIYTLIPEDIPPFFILVRRLAGIGDWSGDPRFTDTGRFVIHSYTGDPDGDWKGAVIQEAVRVVLRNAWLNKWHDNDLGSVIEIQMTQEPSRKTDFATSSGPVQYADLPLGVWRYESTYSIHVRRPRK